MKTISQKRLIVSFGLFAVFLFAATVYFVATSAAQTNVRNLTVNDDLSNVVTPMEISVSGVTSNGTNPSSILVTMNGTNDIGSNANYANALASLQSLKLTVVYQYTSQAGSMTNESYTVTLSPSFSLLTNQHGSFAVQGGSLPSSATGRVAVQVSGWYTWTLNGTNPDGTHRTLNGDGRLPEFDVVVVVQ